MKKLIVMAMAAMAAAVFAEPEVTDVVAKPRYPWNGMVDITCKVTGINGTTNGLKFAVAMVVPDTGFSRSVSCFWVVKDGTKTIDRRVHANGAYRLLWDARTEFCLVLNTKMVVCVTLAEYDLSAHDKVQLWEGGPYWATTIGAEKPEDYGYYFWWGDTVGYKRENDAWVASDGSSSNFLYWNAPIEGKSISTLKSEGWITMDGVLAPEHDAAHVHWGGKWRMPTQQELRDLKTNCSWARSTMNDVKGYIVLGRGDYASASIFLPATGFGTGASLASAGSYGSYWSSVPYFVIDYVWDLDLNWSPLDTSESYSSGVGLPVRPVQGFTK